MEDGQGCDHGREGGREDKDQYIRFMKIANEFETLRDSMENYPLPGNTVVPPLNLGFESQFGSQIATREVGRGRVTDLMVSILLKSDVNKSKIEDLAKKAMDEVMNMSLENEPLWNYDGDKGFTVLNNVEYVKRFSNVLETTLDEIIEIIRVDAPLELLNIDGIGAFSNTENKVVAEDGHDLRDSQSPLKVEASRASGSIGMPAFSIVEIMMDVKLWSFAFAEVLSRAAVLGIISTGKSGTFDEALQVMSAEYHGPSPLVQTREFCFARYCRELASNNAWMIVDVSLESLFQNPLLNSKKRPSGCLIQALPNGHAQVTWIEHVEVDNSNVHVLYKPLVDSGFVYGAQRWVDMLSQQCEYLDAVIHYAYHDAYYQDIPGQVNPKGFENILRLAERMRRNFFGSLSNTKDNMYQSISVDGGKDILVKTLESEQYPTTVITMTCSCWLPFSRARAFDFLCDARNRIKWDVVAQGHPSCEVIRARSYRDLVSLIKLEGKNGEVDTMFLQETYETNLASYVIFSPMSYDSMAVLLSSDKVTDNIPVLASGFMVFLRGGEQIEDEGSVVSMSFQMLDKDSTTYYIPPDTLEVVHNIIAQTFSSIRQGLFEPPSPPDR